MDIRQSPSWGNYLSQIGWKIGNAGSAQIFIRPVPFLHRSLIKIQRPKNPINFKEIDQLAKINKALFVLIEPEFSDYQETTFKDQGFRKSSMTLTHTATIQIDLTQSEENLWRNFSENARRNIKKAQKNDLTVKTISLKNEADDNEFKKFYQLLENLTKIKKFWTPGYDEFYKKMQSFKDNSYLLFAYQGGQPLAAVWLGIFQDKACYMHTGITDTGYKLMANYLLVWESIKLAKKLNLKVYDFEGIYDPRFPKERQKWQSFTEFKKRFHGKIVEYPEPQIKCYSLWYKLIYLCSNLFSKS